jgi:hypothetical protein
MICGIKRRSIVAPNAFSARVLTVLTLSGIVSVLRGLVDIHCVTTSQLRGHCRTNAPAMEWDAFPRLESNDAVGAAEGSKRPVARQRSPGAWVTSGLRKNRKPSTNSVDDPPIPSHVFLRHLS